jgi:uncharacterized Zn finger protein
VNDPLVRHLRWQCTRCGSERGVEVHEVRTSEGFLTYHRCRACAAVVDPTTPHGAVVLTTPGRATRN